MHDQESEPIENLGPDGNERVEEKFGDGEQQDNLDLPIALRKAQRSCTIHPIANYLSYSNLSSAFLVVIEKIRAVIPTNICEALKLPEWKEAVMPHECS